MFFFFFLGSTPDEDCHPRPTKQTTIVIRSAPSRMESVAQSIVSNFGQVLVEELQEIRGVGDRVVHLRDELATMNAALRVISEADQSSVDHLVREWEKQVHDLAYDAEDCTDTYSLRIARPIPLPLPPADDAVGTRLVCWARYMLARTKRIARYPYEKLVLQRALAADIKALLARTTIVSERRARYGIDRAALPRAACFAPVSAASVSANGLRRADDPDQFVGITEQASGLADKIKGIKAPVHDEDDKSLKVFSIVGFGGLGKTTLAMELCRQLDTDFPYQALVAVSQAFDVEKDIKGLLVRVFQQILKEKADAMANQTNTEEEAQTDKMNVEELSRKIKELLDHKRYRLPYLPQSCKLSQHQRKSSSLQHMRTKATSSYFEIYIRAKKFSSFLINLLKVRNYQ